MEMMLAAGTFAVGLVIGWCGVAGFLLPLLFLNACGMSPAESLFTAFSCFLVSGVVGSRNYRRRGEAPMKLGLPLGVASLLGSLAGALIGQVYVSGHIKVVLYVVVLVSGLLIFVQERVTAGGGAAHGEASDLPSPGILIPIGLLTSILCSLSGAGGPVLVMPLLVLLGIPVRTAVGVALFDSIFIAVPAIAVYGGRVDIKPLLPLLLLSLASHAAGIFLGSRTAGRIPQKPLKRTVAAFSVGFAVFMLLRMK